MMYVFYRLSHFQLIAILLFQPLMPVLKQSKVNQ